MSDLVKKPFTLDRVVRLVLTGLAAWLAIYLLRVLSGVLIPFALAAIIAYLMNPLIMLIQKVVKNRVIAVFGGLIAIGLFLFLLGLIIVPLVSKEIIAMSEMLSKFSGEKYINQYKSDIQDLALKYFSEDNVKEFFSEEKLVEYGQNVLTYVGKFFTRTVNVIIGVFSVVSMLIYLIFILLDYERIMYGWQKLIPKKFRAIVIELADDLKDGMNNYFRAQAVVAFIVGIFFAIGFSIIGLPMGIIFGLFVGVLNLVPYLQLASIPPAAFLALIHSIENENSYWYSLGITLLVYVVVQVLQDTVIVPKLMGKVMGLNPAIILLSLSVWGSLLGILGMLIALPVTTLLYAYYERYLSRHEQDEQLHLFEDDD